MTDEPGRLSADDARILAMESAVLTGHTLKLIVLAPGTPLDLDEVRASVLGRLAAEPRALDRVETGAGAGSGPGAAPQWVRAEHFDIAQHVTRRAGTECATRADLWRTVSELMAEHLPRDRPLWKLELIGPLADGTEAIAARLHHAMVDGIAGLHVLESILFDVLAQAAGSPGIPSSPVHVSVEEELLRLPSAIGRELGHPGRRSPFDKPVTAARELAFTAVRLDALRAVGASRPAHATVNDVLLAIVAGGLSSWLGAHDSLRYLRAQVPVSLHARDAGGGSAPVGNHDSFINVDLPLGEHNPLRRLDTISSQTRIEKQQGDAALLYDLFHALDRLSTAAGFVHRIADSSREFTVAISNVPGPREPVTVAGRAVAELFTSSEPAAHHALRISAISNADLIGIGFCTDPTALPGIAALADAVADAFVELHVAALGTTPTLTGNDTPQSR